MRNVFRGSSRPVGILAGLLVLPLTALILSPWDLRWIGAYAITVNALAYLTYLRDKKSAVEGAWRVSETRLHFLELLGGWPAAYMAQNLLRHKSSKLSFRIFFWIIVVAWQLAAIDTLLDWKVSSTIIDSIDLIIKHGGD
jgi:uncharacterized membrane protein YsdA (DUF1294 family)